jgi:hypothetical protein
MRFLHSFVLLTAVSLFLSIKATADEKNEVEGQKQIRTLLTHVPADRQVVAGSRDISRMLEKLLHWTLPFSNQLPANVPWDRLRTLPEEIQKVFPGAVIFGGKEDSSEFFFVARCKLSSREAINKLWESIRRRIGPQGGEIPAPPIRNRGNIQIVGGGTRSLCLTTRKNLLFAALQEKTLRQLISVKPDESLMSENSMSKILSKAHVHGADFFGISSTFAAKLPTHTPSIMGIRHPQLTKRIQCVAEKLLETLRLGNSIRAGSLWLNDKKISGYMAHRLRGSPSQRENEIASLPEIQYNASPLAVSVSGMNWKALVELIRSGLHTFDEDVGNEFNTDLKKFEADLGYEHEDFLENLKNRWGFKIFSGRGKEWHLALMCMVKDAARFIEHAQRMAALSDVEWRCVEASDNVRIFKTRAFTVPLFIRVHKNRVVASDHKEIVLEAKRVFPRGVIGKQAGVWKARSVSTINKLPLVFQTFTQETPSVWKKVSKLPKSTQFTCETGSDGRFIESHFELINISTELLKKHIFRNRQSNDRKDK